MNEPDEEAGGPTLADYARSMWAGRRFVILGALSIGAIAAVFSFIMQPTYQAVTTVIPAAPGDRLGSLSQISASLEDFALQASPKGISPAMYPEIVRSRRLLERVLAQEFRRATDSKSRSLIDLVQPGGKGLARTELAVKKLQGKVVAVVDRRTGMLTIRVRDRSPDLAAGIANELASLLQEFFIESSTLQASEQRKFIEGRLAATQSDLTRAEDQLRAFRERNLRIGNSPRLLLQEGRLTRALREQDEIYLTLRRQYEIAKIEERRDVPVLRVLDAAAIPAFRISPRRKFMTAWGLLAGATLGAALVLTRSGGLSIKSTTVGQENG